MSRSTLFPAALFAVLAGCAGPHPFIRAGDAKSVDVTYSGDFNSVLPLAKEHCRQYELVPRVAYRTAYEAQFDCVSPQPAP